MSTPNYVYACRLVRVIDGDTVEIDVDCGFSIWHRLTVRIVGVNCPEKFGGTKVAGMAAKRFTQEWFHRATALTVRTTLETSKTATVETSGGVFQVDSFRRYLADFCSTVGTAETWLSADLLATGNAVPFHP